MDVCVYLKLGMCAQRKTHRLSHGIAAVGYKITLNTKYEENHTLPLVISIQGPHWVIRSSSNNNVEVLLLLGLHAEGITPGNPPGKPYGTTALFGKRTGCQQRVVGGELKERLGNLHDFITLGMLLGSSSPRYSPPSLYWTSGRSGN